MDHAVRPAAAPVRAPGSVPASKSLHQRALLLAALASAPTRIEAGPGAPGDDVACLERTLAALGPWTDGALGPGRERLTVDLGLGATGFRFSVAAATLRREGARTLVRGRASLMARPHVQLRRALQRLGGRLKRRRSGAIRVLGGGVRGRPLAIRADVSSQYASALLLIAPRIGGLELELLDRPVSRPYLELTLDVLAGFGVGVRATGLDAPHGRIAVEAAAPRCEVFRVEADASCAAVWWAAAALTGGEAEIAGLPAATRQADAALLPILERMGASVEPTDGGGVLVRGGADLAAPGDVDLRDASDLVPLVGALAAAAPGTTRIRGAGHVRFKESDRLQTTAAAIRALGGRATVDGEGLRVEGGRLAAGRVDAAGDHRLVLAFGVLGLRTPGVVLGGAEAVGKSYPSFLDELEEAARGG